MAPRGDVTRPTSDFVREAIFNVLGSSRDLHGAGVADLFAGTGAMGIEALSRGASFAVFVDSDRRAIAAIEENLTTTGLDGAANVHQGDVLRWLGRRDPALAPFDVVFVDPPYAFSPWPDLLSALRPVLAVLESVAVLESDEEIAPGDGWEVLKTKRYGSTVVTLTSPRPQHPPRPNNWSRK